MEKCGGIQKCEFCKTDFTNSMRHPDFKRHQERCQNLHKFVLDKQICRFCNRKCQPGPGAGHVFTHLEKKHEKSMKSVHLYEICKNCKLYQQRQTIQRHLVKCTKYMKYVHENRCTLCLQIFEKLNQVYHHIEEKHRNDDMEKLLAQNRPKILQEIRENMNTKTVITTTSVQCKICKTPKSKNKVKDHERRCARTFTFIDEKNNCKICDKVINTLGCNILYTIASLWGKITLNTGGMGGTLGQGVCQNICKKRTFFLCP